MTIGLRASPLGRARSAGRGVDPDGERGSATILGAWLLAVLLGVFTVGLQLGAAVATRHQAQAAADLAALATAAGVLTGPEAACGQARRVAERMSAELTGCELQGWNAIVRVSARPPGLIERFGVVHATARAGPVVS